MIMQFYQTIKSYYLALVAIVILAMTAQTAWAADPEWPSYITDVVLVGGTESEAQNAKKSYSGYTWCSNSLNYGTSGDVIYIGYKTSKSANTNGGYITDFIVVDAVDHNPPSYVDCNERTYYLCPAAGGDHFTNYNHGNLTSHASGGWNIYLYYTKEHFSNKRAVSSIDINETKSGAIDCYKKDGSLIEENISLNRGVGGTPWIYMHIYTSAKVNRPNPEPTANSGLTYNGSPQKLIPSNYDSDYSGNVYFRLGTTGSYTDNVNSITATNAGTYTIYYYSGESYYGNSSESYAHTMTATIAKAPNSGANVTCSNIIEGTAPSPSLSGTNLSSGTVTYKYSTSQNGTYSTTVPTALGTYWVKATIASDNNYNEYTTAATSFTIIKDWSLHNSGDSEDDPYLISTPEQLILLASRVNSGTGPKYSGLMYRNKFFKVTQDITFTASTTWDDASSTENNYTAIGGVMVGTTRYAFAGTFDGGGKTIKGIRIYQPDGYQEGLFGDIASDAVVKNVSLSETRITGERAGGIVGASSGIVSNCAVSGTVGIIGLEFSHQWHGGIVGSNYGTIEGCRSLAKLTYNGKSSIYWGGIAGSNSGILKNNLAYNATVNCPQSGAIVGKQDGGTLISNYYYNCTINGTSNASNVGAVYGENNTYKLSDVDGARKGLTISGANITVQPTGEATYYNVSKITVYEGNNVLKFLTFFFSSDTKTVSLGLTHSNATGYAVKYYDGNNNELTAGDDNTYTYTMTNKALSISAKLIPDWAQENTGDTWDDAYVISTTDQLNLLSERVNAGNNYMCKYFKLDADITYNKETTNNFTPIGTGSHPFCGNFDGQGHTISKLNISLGSTVYVGLFGRANDATIKNLKLDNSTIGGRSSVGAILGEGTSATKVANCLVTSSVTVSGDYYIGGIVGQKSAITGSACAASVSGIGSIGGIVGSGYEGTVTNCVYTGSSLTGSSSVGAIVGEKGTGATLNYNYYTADGLGGVNGSDIDGARKAVEITSTINGLAFQPTGTAITYDVSGITGYAGNSGIKYTVGNSTKYYAGATESVNINITYTSPYEGFSVTGYTDGVGDTPTALTHVSGDTYTMTMPATTVYITPTSQDLWGVTTAGRDGSAEHPYLITTTEGLDLLASKVNSGTNYAGKYFELGNDITYSYASLGEGESNYTAIGTKDHDFWGHFDGKGHTISGIRINANADNQGLFGYIHYAEVKNLTINDTHITIGSGNKFAGAITGYSNVSNLIENCHITNSVIVSGGDDVGGIVGDMECIVRGCTSAATVSGNNRVGGLVGYLVDDDIENCLVLGATISGNEYVGVLAGEVYYGGYDNCYHIGTSVNGTSGSDAYEFPAATGAMGTKGTTYAAGTDYEGITVYENGLAYNGKYYCQDPWGGSGTKDDPYVIYNTAGMDKLASDVNGGNDYDGTYFVLRADITYDKMVENNYTPIGDNNYSFYGTFDGQGHTISGIRISDTNGVFKAIFGGVGGTVENLVVSDCRFEAHQNIGGIVAYLRGGTIENCHVGSDVTISGNEYVGSIAAKNGGGTVKGCTSAATVRGTKSGSNAEYLGGIVGYAINYGVSPTLTDNLFTGTINGDLLDYIGAIVGCNFYNAATLTNNYHTFSGMGGVNGSDEDGAFLAVSSTTKPSGFGEVTTTYGKDDYIGITAYQYGLYYNGQYYEKDPSLVIWSGRGTEENPYVIRTTAELDLLATNVNGDNMYMNTYFVLGDDIAYDESEDNNYTPIGDNIHPFYGTFDGQGHTISGIRISDTNDETGYNKAIFGMVCGTVKNLVVSDCSMEARQDIGGIVVLLQSGTIENCHVDSDVTLSGHASIGGIAASNHGGTIKGCTSAATITGTNNGVVKADCLGGIACFAAEFAGDTPTLTDNLFTGTISGELWQYIGAIVGQNESNAATLTNNYHTCSGMGGVGNENDATSSDVDGAKFAVSATNKPDAIMGDPTAVYGKDDYIGITAFENGLFYNGQFYSQDPWGGNGTEEDPYIIYTTEGLDLLASRVNSGNDYNGKFFALGADITYDKTVLTLDLDGEEGLDSNFPGIGIDNEIQNPFVGSLDGRGHTISGIVINRPNYQYVGLFGYAMGQYIKNLTLANSAITGENYVGAIVGFGSTNIENCHVTSDVTVSGQFWVGGIVGIYATIQGCTSAATVSGSESIGGILGDGTNSTVRDCLYLGNSVTATNNSYVGAIVGDGVGNLENNYHTCSGMGGVGSIGSDTGDDVVGALFAVTSANKPNAIIGDPTAVYGEDDYIGITAYSPNGLYYNDRYYWLGDVEEIDIYDDDINEEIIVENDGKIVNVLLAGRTFRKDGKWSTIVLPFDVDLTAPDCPLQGAIIRTLTNENNEIAINGTTLNLTFGEKWRESDKDNILMAGRSYLIRWNRPENYEGNESMYDIVDPLFIGVKIKDKHLSCLSHDGLVSFEGNCNYMGNVVDSFTEEFDVLLLGDDNHLHYATPGESLGACRACFVIHLDMIGDSNFRLTDYVFDLGNGEMLSGTFPSIVQPVQPGDANGDGSISVTDIAVVVNCILQLDNTGGFSPDGADANGDGQITVTDIGVIVDKILGTNNSGNAGARRLTHDAVEPQ